MDSRKIEQIAADWVAKHDSGRWTAADERALSDWLNESTAHRIAYLRMKAVWSQASRMQALGAGIQHGTIPEPGRWEPWLAYPNAHSHSNTVAAQEPTVTNVDASPPLAIRSASRRVRVWASAAVVLLVIGVCVMLSDLLMSNTYSTSIGRNRTVHLEDGSRVVLNTNSEIRVISRQRERKVVITRGEAFFTVARDRSRPFAVFAGDKRVVAVGTQFSVLKMDESLRVVVTEGVVRMQSESAEPTSEPPLQLHAGNVALANAAGVIVSEHSVADAEQYLTWRFGSVRFRDSSLEEVVAEINRYNTRQLVIADPSLADLRIAGNIRVDNLDALVRALEQSFEVRATARGNEIILTAR